jgi:hypothetical protein
MGTSRSGNKGVGTYEYDLANGYVATRMGNNDFYIFTLDGTDTGFDFPTLRECRTWADRQAAKDANVRSAYLFRRLTANLPW